MSSATLTKNSQTLVHHSNPVQLRKCYYTGHAATVLSVEHAVNLLDEIGQLFNSDNVLPFSMRLIEGGELIQIGDDNGEFGASNIIMASLQKLEGYNVLVAVSRKVLGCFVSDMVQARKAPVIRQAANEAVAALKDYLENKNILRISNYVNKMNEDSKYSVTHATEASEDALKQEDEERDEVHISGDAVYENLSLGENSSSGQD